MIPPLALWAALALLALAGCARMLGGMPEIRQKRRFTIAVEPLRGYPQDSDRPYQATVQLKTFEIAGAYSQNEIISRRSFYELRRDPLHIWGQRPREMLTDVVGQYLRNAQLFTRLVTDRELLERRPDYFLSGAIRALERFESGDRWFAHLVLSMQLVRQQDGQVVWRGEITAADELEVFNADMQYTVQAISEILRRKMETFIHQLDALFLAMQQAPGMPTPAVVDSPIEVRPDSVVSEREIPAYYELIPGKLAPE